MSDHESDDHSTTHSDATTDSHIDTTAVSRKSTTGGGGRGKGKKPSTAKLAEIAKKRELPKRAQRKVNDNLAGIRKSSIRKMGRRAGIENFTSSYYPEVRNLIEAKLQKIVGDCVAMVIHNKKKTITLDMVVEIFRKQGRTIYGCGETQRRFAAAPKKARKAKALTATEADVNALNTTGEGFVDGVASS